jgi:hypothetical protein
MKIAGLTLEDTTKIYRLRASNSFGVQEYVVRISSSEAAPGELYEFLFYCSLKTSSDVL